MFRYLQKYLDNDAGLYNLKPSYVDNLFLGAMATKMYYNYLLKLFYYRIK